MPAFSAYEARLHDLLRRVAGGDLSPRIAAGQLRDLPFSDLGFAKVDHHRELRQGACEIVYARGQDAGRGPLDRRAPALRATTGRSSSRGRRPSTLDAVRGRRRGGRCRARRATQSAMRRAASQRAATARAPCSSSRRAPRTSASPRRRELTASLLGAGTEIVADVGVAGLHRLSAVQPRLASADAVVVVAGMEGALASVVGGLAAVPGHRVPDERRLRRVVRRSRRAAVDAVLVRARRRVRERRRRRGRRLHRGADRPLRAPGNGDDRPATSTSSAGRRATCCSRRCSMPARPASAWPRPCRRCSGAALDLVTAEVRRRGLRALALEPPDDRSSRSAPPLELVAAVERGSASGRRPHARDGGARAGCSRPRRTCTACRSRSSSSRSSARTTRCSTSWGSPRRSRRSTWSASWSRRSRCRSGRSDAGDHGSPAPVDARAAARVRAPTIGRGSRRPRP